MSFSDPDCPSSGYQHRTVSRLRKPITSNLATPDEADGRVDFFSYLNALLFPQYSTEKVKTIHYC